MDESIGREPAAFVFDVDGCILDSFNYFMKFVPEVYAKFGLNPDNALIQQMRQEIIAMLVGKPSKMLIVRMILHSAKRMGLRFYQRFKFLTYLNALYKQQVRTVDYVPGTLETLRALKEKGYRIAVFTSASKKDYDMAFHEKPELLQLLDDHIVRDDLKRMKPDPEGLFLIMQHLGIKPRHLVMVGDMHHDIRAGLAAGGIAIGVKSGVCSEAELQAAGATFIFDSVADIMPNLNRIEEEMERIS